MKYIALLCTLGIIAILWTAITRLDSQAVAMLTGILIGLLANVPTLLLWMGRESQPETPRRPTLKIGPADTPLTARDQGWVKSVPFTAQQQAWLDGPRDGPWPSGTTATGQFGRVLGEEDDAYLGSLFDEGGKE